MHLGRLEPVYSVSGPVKMNALRKWIQEAFSTYGQEIEEILPRELVERYRLLPRAKAMYLMHFPRGQEEGRQARRRLAYE